MTPTRPRIGVTGQVQPAEGGERSWVRSDYVHAVLAGGGLPYVLSPHAADAADELVAGLDGLLLTGGGDVDPAHYGAPPSPTLRSVDPLRDRFELALVGAADRLGLPLLAVCRGQQLLNVALGGTLWQDLATERPGPVRHDEKVPWDTRTQGVAIRPGTRVAEALATDRLAVNSFHHQGIRDLAPGLVVSATADDGLIEAVESPAEHRWLVGVQWHPESHWAEAPCPDLGLFRALVAAARGAPSVAQRA